MVYYFNKGGFLMYPLLGLFIIGIAFTIVKLWLLGRASINSKKCNARMVLKLGLFSVFIDSI